MIDTKTAFLWNDATWRDHNGLARVNAKRVGVYRKKHRALRHNAVCRYFANSGDFGGRIEPTTFYTVPWASPLWGKEQAVNMREIERMQRIVHLDHSVGQATIAWGMNDDDHKAGKHLWRKPVAILESHWSLIEKHFGEWISFWCLGLELDEYWSPKVCAPRMAALRRVTDKPIMIHLRRDMEQKRDTLKRYIDATKPDAYGHQYGWEDNVEHETYLVRRLVNPLPVIAAEYAKNPSPAEGKAAMRAGAIGVLNG